MINAIKEKVFHKLKDHPNRINHIMGVYETASILANIHHVDEDKTMIAALYHDYAKYDPIEKQIKHMSLKDIKTYANYPVMYHAIAGAIDLEHDFNVKDQDIQNAIRNHVWGRPNMSTLEKIIFISDACEPNRNFEDAQMIFEKAKHNLDEALVIAMKASIDYIIKKGLTPSCQQIEAYQYYMEVNCGKAK